MLKAHYFVGVFAIATLSACSPIPDVCEDDQGLARACDQGMPDMDTSVVADMPMTREDDMCTPRERAVVCDGVCGVQVDGCGGVIDCGAPLTRQDVCAESCGEQSDGCGGTVDCGACSCSGGVPSDPGCGICNLGTSSCQGDAFSCESYEIPGIDAQTDCDDHIMFVDASYGGEDSNGTRERPFKTLFRANAAAMSREAVVAILVAGDEDTIYEEVLSMQDGVSVIGGWTSDWRADRTRKPTFTPPIPDSGDMFGARIEGIDTTRTMLANVRIVTRDFGQARPGQQARHNHGIYAKNASKLILKDLFVQAGKGEDGADGGDGKNGDDGVDGQDGAWGCGQSGEVCDSMHSEGILGNEAKPGIAPCDISGETGGGLGGLGSFSTEGNGLSRTFETSGNGQDSRTAKGGMATFGEMANGGNGEDASPLPDMSGLGAAGDCSTIMFMGDTWATPSSCDGTRGEDGQNGFGGAGGAGAGHSYSSFMIDGEQMTYKFGPDGGAGGSGGCAGHHGMGGMRGGSSSSMLVHSSTGIQITNSAFFTVKGGNGGRGGDGGQGGQGGKGGIGGKLVCLSYSVGGPFGYMLPCMSSEGAQNSAGDGGNGSPGSSGGHGGGGGGGSSFGLYCIDTLLFDLDSNTVAPGESGLGGVSMGNSGINGVETSMLNCE